MFAIIQTSVPLTSSGELGCFKDNPFPSAQNGAEVFYNGLPLAIHSDNVFLLGITNFKHFLNHKKRFKTFKGPSNPYSFFLLVILGFSFELLGKEDTSV